MATRDRYPLRPDMTPHRRQRFRLMRVVLLRLSQLDGGENAGVRVEYMLCAPDRSSMVVWRRPAPSEAEGCSLCERGAASFASVERKNFVSTDPWELARPRGRS
jgi:hypothetical protein